MFFDRTCMSCEISSRFMFPMDQGGDIEVSDTYTYLLGRHVSYVSRYLGMYVRFCRRGSRALILINNLLLIM